MLSKTTFGGLRDWDWSGLLRQMPGSRQKGGGEHIIGGGRPKALFGEGFYLSVLV